MFSNLKSKLIIPIIATFIVVVGAIVIVVNSQVEQLIDMKTTQQLLASSSSINSYIGSLQQQALMSATSIAQSYEVINILDSAGQMDQSAVASALVDYMAAQKDLSAVDSIVIVNRDGYALARSHLPDMYGDYGGGAPTQAALRGEVVTMFTPTPTVPLVLAGTSPIMHNGELIGGIAAMINIGLETYVDHISQSFGTDFAIFLDDTVIATTLVHPETGERAVGMEAQQEVLDAVRRGESIVLQLDIFGLLPYYAYFQPLFNLGGESIGMFFVGLSIETSRAAGSFLQMVLIGIGAVGVIVAGLVAIWIVTRVLRPINKLATTVREVSVGNINVNIDRRVSKDEVGRLTLDIYSLVDSIKNLVDDINTLSHEFIKTGDIEYRIDTSKYENSFKDLMEGTNAIVSNLADDIMPAIIAVNKIASGNFDIAVRDLPGKKVILPQAIRSITGKLNNIYEAVNDLAEGALK